MHVIPFQIDSGKDSAGNTVPGAADGARQYGERLGCEEIASQYRSKTGVLHSYLNTDVCTIFGWLPVKHTPT